MPGFFSETHPDHSEQKKSLSLRLMARVFCSGRLTPVSDKCFNCNLRFNMGRCRGKKTASTITPSRLWQRPTPNRKGIGAECDKTADDQLRTVAVIVEPGQHPLRIPNRSNDTGPKPTRGAVAPAPVVIAWYPGNNLGPGLTLIPSDNPGGLAWRPHGQCAPCATPRPNMPPKAQTTHAATIGAPG